MPTLYALLVGIDRYKGDSAKLSSARSDAEFIEKYLRNHINRQAGFNLKVNLLHDQQAKKKDVIAAFRDFEKARGEDVCLFYFAGHGSEIECPPEELEHLTRATGKFETIICHDSRTRKGSDLTDQEIAHLIGTTVNRANFSGNGHFAVIMDCCHSGHGTRVELDEQSVETRAVKSRYTQRLEDFYGYSRRGAYPERGEHVQLASCSHRQRALDGYYTKMLVDELTKKGANRTYAQIHAAVKRTVQYETGRQQTPDFFADPALLRGRPFLGGAVR